MDERNKRVGPNGRYVLTELLGAGGMGDVYAAFDERLRREVAIKVLRPALARNPQVRRRFENEALIQHKLRHPHILEAMDILEDESLAIVMALVEGPTLEEHVLDELAGGVSAARVLAVMKPVLEAVEYAHSQGVIHRDLKPANVLLDRSAGYEVPLVADFGIARITEEVGHTRTGASMGSAGFMSPEQLRDASSVDERADVYSLGAMLYFVLGGEVPYGVFSEADRIHRVMSGEAPAPLRLDADLEGFGEVALKAMSHDVDARFTSVRQMRQALEGSASNGVASAQRPSETHEVQAGVVTPAAEVGEVWRAASVESPQRDVADANGSSVAEGDLLLAGARDASAEDDEATLTIDFWGAMLLSVLVVAVLNVMMCMGRPAFGAEVPPGEASADARRAPVRSLRAGGCVEALEPSVTGGVNQPPGALWWMVLCAGVNDGGGLRGCFMCEGFGGEQ